MVVGIKVRDIELATLEDNQYGIVFIKFAQQSAVVVIVDAVYVGVEPHLAAAQGRVAVALQAHTVHRVARYEQATSATTLDGHLREVAVDKYLTQLGVGLQRHLNHLGLAIRVGSKVEHTRALLATRQVVVAVAHDRGQIETFNVNGAVLSVAIHGVVGCAAVVAIIHAHPQHVLAHKYLVGHAHHTILAIAEEHHNVVNI